MTAKSAKLRLAISTTLASGLLFVAAPAWAQNLPDTGNVTNINGGLGGAVPTTPVFTQTPTPTGTDLRVDLRNNRTILNWGGTGFNIAAGNSVNFKDARATSGVTNRVDNIAVLNRDMLRSPGGNQSQIFGSITSDPNVAVYVINSNGIIFGGSSVVNTGSFTASTMNVTDPDFLDGDSSLSFTAPGPYFNVGIGVVSGAQFHTAANSGTTGGRMGDLVLLGGSVGLGTATLDAHDGDILIAEGGAATIQNAPGSPLSFTLTSGGNSTALTSAANITGRNVTLAIGGQSGSPTPIMTLSGTIQATGAAATDNGVVLLSGGDDFGLSGTKGTIQGPNGESPAVITSASNIYLRGAGATLGNLTADRAIDSGSGLSALDVRGSTVRVYGGLIAQNVTATAGDIVIDGQTSNSSIQVSGTLRAAGGLNFTGASYTTGATILGGDLKLVLNQVGFLGDVQANKVDVRATSRIKAGNVTAPHGVSLIVDFSPSNFNTGFLQVGTVSASASDGDVVLQGEYIANINDQVFSPPSPSSRMTVSAGRDISIISGNKMLLNDTVAGRNLFLQAGTVDATRLEGTSGWVHVIGLANNNNFASSGTVTVGTIVAGTGITSSGAQTLIDSLSTTLGDILVTSNGTIRLGGATGAGAVSAGGNITINGSSSAQLRGTVTSGGDIAVTGSSVILGSTTAATIKAKGAITLTSTTAGVSVSGTTTVQSNSDGVGSEPITILSATTVSTAAASLLLGGTNRQSDVQIRSGANSGMSLGAITARGLLGATGSDPFANGITRNASISLTGAINLINSLSVQGTSLGLTGGATVSNGDIDLRSNAALTIGGALNASRDVTVQSSTGNLTIAAAGSVTGRNIVLSTPAGFINNAGSSAVTASGHWVIYSNKPSVDTFGGLASNNKAYWNASYASLAPGSLTGNRFVFQYQPIATYDIVNSIQKTYGVDLTHASFSDLVTSYGVTYGGYSETSIGGIAGAYLPFVFEDLQGLPSLSSPGFDPHATVAGGPYLVTLGLGTLHNDYGWGYGFLNRNMTVNPAQLTATITASSKTYDGTRAATGSVSLNGILFNDDVGTTGSVFTFADKNAGTGKTVTASGTALSGADASNYTLGSVAAGLADILKKALTGTITANGKTYDGTRTGSGSIALSGTIAGDSIGTTGTLYTFADKNAGTGKTVTISGTTLSGADAGNYTLALSATATADILKKALTGTATANNKTYDGTSTGSGSVALSGTISGDSIGTTGSVFTFADKNAGAGKTVTVSGTSLSGADAGNYTLALSATTTADILRKALTGTGTVNSKTYDGTTAATGGTVTLSGVVAGDSVGTSGSGFAFADKNAGTGKAVNVTGTALTGADAANYTLGAIVAAGDILKKAISGAITANAKTYDGTRAGSGSIALSGVVSGDAVGTAGSVFTFADKNAGTGKTVAVTGTTLSGADAGNYTLSLSATATADILKKALTGNIAANNKTYDGTTGATGSVLLSGVVAGDDVVTSGTVLAFANKNAGTGKTVTATGTTLSGADAGNYTLSVNTGLADILKKALTGTYAVDGKTYDGTTAATGSVLLNGLVAGDTVGTTGVSFAFADKNAGLGKLVNVTGSASLTGADAANYSLTPPSGSTATGDIFRKSLTGTVNANSKTYDGTTAATGTVSVSGVIQGDDVSAANFVLSFADKNAGIAKLVLVAGTLSGADAGNYSFSDLTGTADILKKALTGTVTANNKTYDGTRNGSGSIALSGVVSGDSVGTAGSVFTFADKNAGTGKAIAVSGTTLNGADAGNYTVSVGTGIADILKKALTGTITANNKTYDGTTGATGSIALSGVVSGDDVGTTGAVLAFADKNAGTAKTVTATGTALSGADAGNYTLGSIANGIADILKKALTGAITANGKTYDGTRAGTGSIALSGVVSGDAVGTAGSVFTFADKNAGTGKTVAVTGTTLSGADAGNYTLSLSATATADILKKALTGTIAANDKTYDGTTGATGTLILSGVVAGDDVATSGTVLAFADKNAGTGKTVSATGTALSGADAGNYTLSVNTGLADILKKALAGTVTANSKTYDGTTAGSGTVSITGVIAGDSVGTTGSVFTFANKNAGAGKAVTITGTTLNGADAGNYTLTLPASALADILRKSITGSITVTSRQYDGTTAGSGTIALNGVVSGDTVGTTGTVFTFSDKNAGTGKTVTVSGTTLNGADAANYILTPLPGTALGDILKRVIAVSADDKSKTNGDDDPLLTFTITAGSLVSGDSIAGLLARAAGETPGTYAISIGTLSAGGNYQLNFTPGVFTIQIDPASQIQQTLKAIPLPSQIQGQQSSGSSVTIDKDALCGEDTTCTAK